RPPLRQQLVRRRDVRRPAPLPHRQPRAPRHRRLRPHRLREPDADGGERPHRRVDPGDQPRVARPDERHRARHAIERRPVVPRLDWRAEGDKCVTLLRDLLRIPTVNRGTNEPGDGNERPAAELLADFLREAGVEPKLYEKTKGRTNVVARVKGTGERPPLLL